MKNIYTIAYIAGLLTGIAALMPGTIKAQSAPETAATGNVKLAANTSYNEGGKFKRVMLGEHYRKEWAQEVEVRVLDMDTTGGGLTPVQFGGGMQTKSLRLKAANGKEYVLRSVNKDPSKALVKELRGTFAEDLIQDQISSSNPYAPLVVSYLAEAAGIFHSTPEIVYVPQSAKLGEFSFAFAGTLCLLEERASGNEENNPAFGYSKKVINSEKLLEKIYTNSNHQVDAKAFLKARLFDILIGDWDRHEDQWQWAAFENGNKTFYKPIPRDRDQAFAKLDGFIPQLATRKWAMRKIQHFDYNIRDLNGLAASGTHLDRNFTTSLTMEEWLKVASELQNSITDEVIATAFQQLPISIYNISGKKTADQLKRRKDFLLQYALEYYQFLSEQVYITGTSETEIFEVKRINNDTTLVTVYKTNTQNEKSGIIFRKTFLRTETKEIRLYGLGGNDQFHISGAVKKGIVVRVIGGEGQDSVKDNSFVKQSGSQTKIYDNEESLVGTTEEAKQYISSDTLKNNFNRRSFAFDLLSPTVNPGYNPDDGFFIGGGVLFKKQMFGKSPYGYMQQVAANYASATGAYSIWYNGVFTGFVGRSDLHLSAKYHSPRYARNFYGIGNETVNDKDAAQDYYRVRLSEYSFSSSLQRKFGAFQTLSIGNEFQTFKVEENEDRVVSSKDSRLDSSDFGRKNYSNISVKYQFSTVDNLLYPTKGITMSVATTYTHNLKESDKDFVRFSSEIIYYKTFGRITIASRSGIATNIGDDYEFFQANTLGQLTNLRGYRKERYSGKTSVYHNTEVRIPIGGVNAYIVKGAWGVLAFADHGRVWAAGEDSDLWHHGYGGGLWILPFNKMALTGTYGASKEGGMINIKAGFLF